MARQIIFVTHNKTKLTEAKEVMSSFGIKVIGKDIKLAEIQSTRQIEVVKYKARAAYQILKKPVIIDDTVFYLTSYPGFPGVMTKYIVGLLGLNGFSKLFNEGERGYFLCMVCYTDGKYEIVTEGKLSGVLTKKKSTKLNTDTPISSIFIPDNYERPLIELKEQRKIDNLHRIMALKKLCNKLQKL